MQVIHHPPVIDSSQLHPAGQVQIQLQRRCISSTGAGSNMPDCAPRRSKGSAFVAVQPTAIRGVSSVLLRDVAFCRFTQGTGRKPSEYQKRLQISRAREILESSRAGIDEIAARVGRWDQVPAITDDFDLGS